MSQQALFDIGTPPDNEPGAIETSILDTVKELEEADLLHGKIQATCVTLIHSARAVDRQLANGKLTVAATQMTKQILESLEKLPEPKRATGSAFDSLDVIIRELTLEALGKKDQDADLPTA